MITLEKLIDQSGKLGSLPAIVQRIFEVMDNPDSTAIQIGRIINEDPALTARLLKLVNSPFYGFVSRVDTVYRAIALIGHSELRSVVLATSSIRAFDGIPADLVDMEAFWKRSLNTAVVARVLAAFRREQEIERYFIAGLLHDIGSLLLYLQEPEQQAQAIVDHHAKKNPLWQAEQQVFGFDHAEVGGALLKNWNLPPMLYLAVQYHPYPDRAPEEYRQPAWLAHLAWQIVRHHIERDSLLDEGACIDAVVWEMNELSPELLPQILEKAEQQFMASKDIILN